jgi:hypothetical protein
VEFVKHCARHYLLSPSAENNGETGEQRLYSAKPF